MIVVFPQASFRVTNDSAGIIQLHNLDWMNKGMKIIFVKSASVSLPFPLGSPMIDSFKQWRELT